MARCRGKNDQGEPCGTPETFVGPSGWCPAHEPGGRERLREAGRLGAEVSKQVRRKGKGLRPGELGSLQTPRDAERWLRIIGRAVTEGRLRSKDADAGTRAVREWLRAHEAGAVVDQVAELRRKVSDLKGDKLEVLK
jgi:hypothetical protein